MFDSLPVTLATEGWKWALKVHEQGEVDSNRLNRCRLLDRDVYKRQALHIRSLFASGTYEQNKEKIEEIMTKKILDLWEG